jgi:hypothetical protein
MVVQKPRHMNQKAPHLNSKKTDIINWLSEHNKPQSNEMMELHLYQFILIYKVLYTNFSMDQMCSNYGHINLIYPLIPQWQEFHNNHLGTAKIKDLQRNIRFKVEVQQLCEQILRATGIHKWCPVHSDVRSHERAYIGKRSFSQCQGGAVDITNYIVASTTDEFSGIKDS